MNLFRIQLLGGGFFQKSPFRSTNLLDNSLFNLRRKRNNVSFSIFIQILYRNWHQLQTYGSNIITRTPNICMFQFRIEEQEASFGFSEYINSMRKQSQNLRSPLKSFQSLQSFKLDHHEKCQIYHNAVDIPQFLVDNLKSEHRVIKEFTGQDAILKAFYFNLMKLAFQLETEETNYAQLVQEMLTGQQEFGIGELQDKHFSDKQYRSFLRQFFDVLQGQQIPNFEETVESYPIIDEILLKLFKQLVPFTLKLKDCPDFEMTRRILEYLAKKFKIKLQVISGCFKFVESDIFMYIGSATHIYLIFMDQLAFIREVTEQASSRMSKSNTSMSNCSAKDDKAFSKTQIKNSEKNKSSDKKVFTTVINMLDSKKTPTNSQKLSSSIRCRNSLEQDFENMPIIFQKGSDRIEERDKSSVQEYYDTSSVEPQIKNVASYRPISKNEFSKKNILQSQTFPVSNQQNHNRLSSPYSRQIDDKTNKRVNQLALSSTSTPLQSQSPGKFQLPGAIMNPRPALTKAQTYTQSNQNRREYVSPVRPSNFDTMLKESRSKEKTPTYSQGYYETRQPRSLGDAFKKPTMDAVSSKLSSHLNKNSNLEIFSDIKDKNFVFQVKNSKVQGQTNSGFGKYEVKQNRDDDSSYQKFTDSGLLQILDEEYRTRIKSIKQKYREKRSKVQPGF